MTTRTLTLTGYLGRDAQIRLTTPREYRSTRYDPILDGEVVCEGETAVTEYARLSIAVHDGTGRRRTTSWYELRAWDLDHHPDERKIRTAFKGQRVAVQGFEQVHCYTDREGREREFRYLVVTGFRPRPGKLFRSRLAGVGG